MEVTLLAEGAESLPTRVRVELVKARRRRDVVVHTEDVALPTGPTRRARLTRIDLGRILDTDGQPALRRGRYFVRVTPLDPPAPSPPSRDVHVRLLTSRRLEHDYLHGLARLPADVLQPRQQPRALTGLEIVDVSPTTRMGFGPLACAVDASGQRFLQWADGRQIALDPRFRRFILPDSRDGFIEVEVPELDLLPNASIEEPILIDRARLGPDTLGRYIDRATDWLERTALQLFLEPTILCTDADVLARPQSGLGPPAPALRLDADEIVPPLTFFVQPAGKWTGLRFPYAHVTRVFVLVGQLAGVPVLELPMSWIQLQEKIGFAQIVPAQGQATWSLMNLLAADVFHGAVELPGFWHFAIRAGLRETPADLLEAIGKRAAIDALTAIGQAFKPGVSSESISKEMSVSTSYVRNAQANLLSATRAEYKADLDALVPRLKSRYLGLSNVAIV